jgi:hypothetical protein
MRRLTTVFCLLALAGALTACKSKPNDEAIAKDIQTTVATDPVTQDSQIAVESNEGKVTLKGKAKTAAARQHVELIAKQAPGVTGVDDQTTVEGQDMAAASAPAPAAAPAAAPAPAPLPTPDRRRRERFLPSVLNEPLHQDPPDGSLVHRLVMTDHSRRQLDSGAPDAGRDSCE